MYAASRFPSPFFTFFFTSHPFCCYFCLSSPHITYFLFSSHSLFHFQFTVFFHLHITHLSPSPLTPSVSPSPSSSSPSQTPLSHLQLTSSQSPSPSLLLTPSHPSLHHLTPSLLFPHTVSTSRSSPSSPYTSLIFTSLASLPFSSHSYRLHLTPSSASPKTLLASSHNLHSFTSNILQKEVGGDAFMMTREPPVVSETCTGREVVTKAVLVVSFYGGTFDCTE